MGTNVLLLFGGAKEDRTPDLLHAMQALSQLSYGPSAKKRHYTGFIIFVQVNLTLYVIYRSFYSGQGFFSA